MRLTVITCTLNPGRAAWDRMIASLRAQDLPPEQWEYLIIDNGSEPPLAAPAGLPGARVVRELEKGLTRARLRGVVESRGEILLFVDDDMLLAPDYLRKSLEYFDRYPFVGALGGFGTAEYEMPLEPWMEPFRFIWIDLTNVTERQAEFQYALTPQPGAWVPIGAGMSVRRKVAEAYREMVLQDPFRLNLDRAGNSLCGSGDADLAYTAIDLGLACATSSKLRFTHLIPRARMEFRYLERLLYASNFYTAKLLVHRGWKEPLRLPPDRWWHTVRWWVEARLPRSKPANCWRAFAIGFHDGRIGNPFRRRYT